MTKKILITKNTTIKAHKLNFKNKEDKSTHKRDKMFGVLDVEIQKTRSLNYSFKEKNTYFYEYM